MCLTVDTCLTADPGITRLIPAWSHTSVEVDHEIISMAPLIQEGFLSINCKQKYVHEVLVNGLVKLAQEKVWLGELTVST